MGGGRLPVVNGKRVIQALKRTGFFVDQFVASRHVLVFPEYWNLQRWRITRSLIRRARFQDRNVITYAELPHQESESKG
jgi:hypothetical protein